jgi:argininosuccinate lyase
MELIRGKAGKVVADATGLLITIKGLPLAYNKDMQETQQPVFSAAEQVASMLRVATGYLATVTFNYERMQEAASGGFMNALAAAAYLVQQGVPFRKAHEQVGNAVQLCVEKSCELDQLSAQELSACGIEANAEFYRALILSEVLEVHNVPGGTAPQQVKAALQKVKARLSPIVGVAHVGA